MTVTFVLAGYKIYDNVPHALGIHKRCRILNHSSWLQNWSRLNFLVIKDRNAFASVGGGGVLIRGNVREARRNILLSIDKFAKGALKGKFFLFNSLANYVSTSGNFFIRIWIIPSSSESFNNRESDQLELSTKTLSLCTN